MLIGDPAAFDGSDSGIQGGTSSSSNRSDIGIILYTWDFDAADGVNVNATGPTAEWIYDRAGEYEVTLTVFDSLGRRATDVISCRVVDDATDIEPPCTPVLCGLLGCPSLALMLSGFGDKPCFMPYLPAFPGTFASSDLSLPPLPRRALRFRLPGIAPGEGRGYYVPHS